MTNKKILAVALAQALATMAIPAFAAEGASTEDAAQAAPSTEEKAPAGKTQNLDAVVVTAQKREQNIQDVPISVSAISGAQLEQRGIGKVDDLNSLAPGLTIVDMPSNSTNAQIAIRGSVQNNPAIYWDPAVGIYLDGVYLGKTMGGIFDIVDLQRVEVLRGPQGTLYGRNTIGGAINLITSEPSGEWLGKASTDFGNYGAFNYRASIDLPKMGIVSLGLGVQSTRRDGWVNCTAGSSCTDLNDRHTDAARFAAKFDLTDSLKAIYRFDYSDLHQSAPYGQLGYIDPNSAPLSYFPGQPFAGISYFIDPNRSKTATINSPAYENSRVQGHSLTLDWAVNDNNDVKSITAFRKLHVWDANDFDGSPYPLFWFGRDTHYNQFSQELQWVGHTDTWNYAAGLYYFRDNGFTDNPQYFFGGAVHYASNYGTNTEAYAAYSQVDWTPIERLTLTGGLRYTDETKGIVRGLTILQAGSPAYPLIPNGTSGDKKFTATTPAFTVSWKLDERSNVYLRYAKGFKSGGFNGEFSDTSQSPQYNRDQVLTPFQPETNKSWELGYKTSFADNFGSFSAAAYHNKVGGMQQSIFIGSGAAATVVRNAAGATIKGLELEAAIKPWDGTRISFNYAYMDAKYDSYIDAGQEVAGNRAYIHAPKNTWNFVVDSRLAQTRWGNLVGTLDYAYTDGYYVNPYQLASSGADYNPAKPIAGDTWVNSRGMLNLRLGLMEIPLGEKLTGNVSLWVRNATDVKDVANWVDFGPAVSKMRLAFYPDPRTYGLTVGVRW